MRKISLQEARNKAKISGDSKYDQVGSYKTIIGSKFETLTKNFLITDTQYKKRFKNVMLWNDWEYKDSRDTGIDLVAREYNGEWCAIQCKCYKDDSELNLKSISTFFTKVRSLEKKHKTKINTILAHTSGGLTTNAESTVRHNRCHIIDQGIFNESSIDWSDFPKLKTKPTKQLRDHQKKAFQDVLAGLKTDDRGMMIMACGTGKTLTSLRIAEKNVGCGGTVLYLVPSISLIHQTMKEWSENANIKHNYGIVCSDKTIGEEGDITELVYPPTTDVEYLKGLFSERNRSAMTIIFSTYQSIDVVSKAIDEEFDLILCDEAHRTTGVENDKYFTKVHHDHNVKAKKRLYMTATPRIYSESVRNDGKLGVHSMNDPKTYGKKLHNYTFSQAVDDGQLSDFKVRIPVISEDDLKQYAQEALDGQNEDGTIDERVLLAAVWHGLNYNDQEKMPLLQRVIAFSNKIESSKQFSGPYLGNNSTVDEQKYVESLQNDGNDKLYENRSFKNSVKNYERDEEKSTGNTVSVRHIDGKMRASTRSKKLQWLMKSDCKKSECRILSNARCLSEGVDVPSLDGIIFLHPRKSKIDVVQSVGRVMRKVDNKEFGYIILPVVIPTGLDVDLSLIDNKSWKIVWQVLTALRSHDANFANAIDRLNLTKGPSEPGEPHLKNVEIIWMGSLSKQSLPETFGKIMTSVAKKCGDREYYPNHAKQLGRKARQIQEIIQIAYDRNKDNKNKNNKITDTISTLRDGLRAIVNKSISETDAIQALAQHYTLAQIFDVLFEKKFRKSNHVVQVLDEAIIKVGLSKELEVFSDYYENVKKEISAIENIERKQTYLKEIYGNFLLGFDKENQKKHGVVYTPNEVIDFIIHSVEYVLRTEFGTGFNRGNVKTFDPFTGTGAFITRLFESDLIKQNNLERKFKYDVYANEISLLAYYVATLNIESVVGKKISKQLTFKNINYTDTLNHEPRYRFDSKYRRKVISLDGNMQKIQDKIQETQWQHIHVILGNPPYSVYTKIPYEIDKRITETFGSKSYVDHQTQIRALRDSYVRSIRWAADRIGKSGVIAFVTNASFLRTEITVGMRACLEKEFNEIWCFDLRGDQRTQGEISKKEGGKIFGSGSRSPIVIIFLIKNTKKKDCTIYYKDIGDHLDRNKKLQIIKKYKSIQGIKDWQIIIPDKNNDWFDKRNHKFNTYTPLGSKEVKSRGIGDVIFKTYSHGTVTSRDSWAYNSSKSELVKNMTTHIEYCNNHVKDKTSNLKKCKWTDLLRRNIIKKPIFNKKNIRIALYRPFLKQYLYFDKTNTYTERISRLSEIFPNEDSKNVVICVPYKFKGEFSVFVSNILPDYGIIFNTQCFPLFTYTNDKKKQDNITDSILNNYKEHYNDNKISKQHIFNYIYGLLHHKDYNLKFKNNLTKEFPHIPMAPDFWAFQNIGSLLMKLHLKYDSCAKYNIKSSRIPEQFTKIRFGTKTISKNGKDKTVIDKTILQNEDEVIFENIPQTNYKVNGRSPIEWFVDRYNYNLDKESDIINNILSEMTGQQIIDQVCRLIHVGIESDRLINSLPKEFEPKTWIPKKIGIDRFTDGPGQSTL